jgi:hypothetical protein
MAGCKLHPPSLLLLRQIYAALRKIAAGEKCGGRKIYAKRDPKLVNLARQLHRPDPQRRPQSPRKIAAGLAEQGYVTPSGRPNSASAVASMLV